MNKLAARNHRPGGIAAAAILTAGVCAWAASDDAVPYPEGYRQWVHVSSAYVGPESAGYEKNGGLHHIYANREAMEGYRTGRFPDGSTIVVDFLERRESKGVVNEGPRRRLDVMFKDSKRRGESGGWAFEQFKGDSQTERLVTAEIAADCFACHTQRKEQDFVFSTFRK
jgi:hypothetical protein